MTAVIPLHCSRLFNRGDNYYLYALRHWSENAFLKLKQWRGIATRCAKRTDSFLAAVQIRCIAIWAKIY